ncbi:hypothetical protein D3C72_2031480 [compost metagenome]
MPDAIQHVAEFGFGGLVECIGQTLAQDADMTLALAFRAEGHIDPSHGRFQQVRALAQHGIGMHDRTDRTGPVADFDFVAVDFTQADRPFDLPRQSDRQRPGNLDHA